MPRYLGGLFVDSVVDWVASSVIGLPRILYYSKEALVRLLTSSISCLFYSILCGSSKIQNSKANWRPDGYKIYRPS